MLAYLRARALFALAPPALVLADAPPTAFPTLAPLALVLAETTSAAIPALFLLCRWRGHSFFFCAHPPSQASSQRGSWTCQKLKKSPGRETSLVDCTPLPPQLDLIRSSHLGGQGGWLRHPDLARARPGAPARGSGRQSAPPPPAMHPLAACRVDPARQPE